MRPVVPLGELVSIQRGTTYKSALLGRPGPFLLGLASIARNGGFRSDSLKSYGGDSPAKLLVQPGQLFASLKDVTQAADLLGSVARVPNGSKPGRLTQDTVRLDVINDHVHADYLYWLLRGPEYRQFCRAHATGTTNLGLPREDFLAFPVWLPSLEEQRRIAEVLGALDDLIGSNEKLISDLTHLFDAASTSVAIGTASMVVLGSKISLYKGLSYKGAHLASTGVPLVNLGSFSRGGRFSEAGTKYYNGPIPPSKMLKRGDLVVANTDLTQGRLFLARPILVKQESASSTHHTFHVRCDDPASRAWVYALLRDESRRVGLTAFATGTTVLALPADALTSLRVPWPNGDALTAWFESVHPLLECAWALEEEIESLRRTRDELLSLLMSSAVRVSAA